MLVAEILGAKFSEAVPYIDSQKLAVESLVGLKYDIFTHGTLNAGLGTKVADGLFAPDWRVYAGLNLTFDVLNRGAPKSTVVQEVNKPELHLHMRNGFLPEDIEALRHVPFDTIMAKHEFTLRKTVQEADYEADKPPFEVFRFGQFGFDVGSSKIRPESLPLIQRLAKYLAAKPAVMKIRIEGHTDSLGSPDFNRQLGQSRADRLKDQLVEYGFPPTTPVEALGYRPDRPIADNRLVEGRALNRRVEVRILRELPPQPETVKVQWTIKKSREQSA